MFFNQKLPGRPRPVPTIDKLFANTADELWIDFFSWDLVDVLCPSSWGIFSVSLLVVRWLTNLQMYMYRDTCMVQEQIHFNRLIQDFKVAKSEIKVHVNSNDYRKNNEEALLKFSLPLQLWLDSNIYHISGNFSGFPFFFQKMMFIHVSYFGDNFGGFIILYLISICNTKKQFISNIQF